MRTNSAEHILTIQRTSARPLGFEPWDEQHLARSFRLGCQHRRRRNLSFKVRQ